MSSDTREAQVPGAQAEKPSEVAAKGWFQIAKRAWAEAKADQVPLLSAGVAFYAFLSIFPAFIAAILLYSLVAEPEQITDQVESFASGLPTEAQELLTGQLENLAADQQSVGIGLVIAVGLALWSAAGGMGNMITAVNIAYDEEEERGFVKRKVLALALTLGAIVFMILTLALVAVFPAVIDQVVETLGLPSWATVVAEVLRWLVLLVALTVALAVLYRYAPDRDAPKVRWVTVGATIATVLWILASVGFSLYVNNFGSYGDTYGPLAGVVVLLLWLWITCYAILLGAEANAESEQQTAKDTTKGPEQPIGERGAVKADSPPGGEADRRSAG